MASKTSENVLLHNSIYCFTVRASGGAKVPRYLATWIVDIYLNGKVKFYHKTNFSIFPRQTETAIASIAGQSPAFCE